MALEFEGRSIPIRAGDTIAAALHRAGVRTFSRSFKFHRPRGLYCGTGDCPNCSMVVDGEPAVRTCVTPARDGQRVNRPTGWPSADFDVWSSLWHVRALLPTGFYYKSMIHPKELWPVAERYIRRLAGLGEVPLDHRPDERERLYHHTDVCVIGGGRAGVEAALEARAKGHLVVLVDEGELGDKLPSGSPAGEAVASSIGRLRADRGVTVIERGVAVGVYEGPLVPVAAPDFLHLVMPGRVIVATGASEVHPAFPGNDLPGVWLSRGAARFAALGLSIGRRAVAVVRVAEGLEQVAILRRAGVDVAALLIPSDLADQAPAGIRLVVGGNLVEARGRNRLRAVVVEQAGRRETVACDALVLAAGLLPRDGLVRQAAAAGVAVETVGDVARPGADPGGCAGGIVCLCEDVTAADLDLAWHEGYQGTELLKRYTTATMGPCQGAMCHASLRRFVAGRSDHPALGAPTTARPPARPVRMEDVAAGARYPLEWHTALHDRHLEMGATMEWAGIWKRAERYGDVLEEYRAVRERVSIMDVSTLGKYRVAGKDATEFLERLYPCWIRTIKEGRSRYALVLNEAGYVFDDGLVCSLGPDGYYLTFTSGGADVIESWLRDWADTWGLAVRIANQTATLGAINLAGPLARDLLQAVADGPVDGKTIPYGGVASVTVAGVDCLVLRVGFVGELSFELHHQRRDGLALWNALLEAGRRLGLAPHGLEALRLLRLEKGHIIVGQDTDFDSTPAKLGLDWAARMDKPWFVGKTALRRLAGIPPNRVLRPFVFPGPSAPHDGAQLVVGSERVGCLTSSRFSPVLGHGIALGWLYDNGSGFADRVTAIDESGRSIDGTVSHGPFYDPEGTRLRA